MHQVSTQRGFRPHITKNLRRLLLAAFLRRVEPRPLAVELFDKAGDRPPDSHLVDVPVRVALLVLLLVRAVFPRHGAGRALDDRMLLAEVSLVLAELLAPVRVRALHELVAEKIESLPRPRVPVGFLVGSPARKATVLEDVRADERLELRGGGEHADVADRREDARGEHFAAALDSLEVSAPDRKLRHGFAQILFARFFFGEKVLEDGVVRFDRIERRLDLSLGEVTLRREEDLADEALAEALLAGDARLLGFASCAVELGDRDAFAIRGAELVEEPGFRFEDLREVHMVRVLFLLGPPRCEVVPRQAIDRGADRFPAARERRGEAVARAAEDHGDFVAGFKSLGFLEGSEEEIEFRLVVFEREVPDRAILPDVDHRGAGFAFRGPFDSVPDADDSGHLATPLVSRRSAWVYCKERCGRQEVYRLLRQIQNRLPHRRKRVHVFSDTSLITPSENHIIFQTLSQGLER